MLIFPNAKINIGLNIIRKRSDGYHDIESLLVPIHLCDVLEILPAPDHQFRFFNSGIPLPDDGKPNLCERAWQLLHTQYGIGPVHIYLHKVIPAGAGLGGGSSDAAFTLKALNQLYRLNLPKDALLNLSSLLGSDCPFFIENKPMLVAGRGEILEPAPYQPDGLKLLLVVPNIHVSTAVAYSKVIPQEPAMPIHKILSEPVESWKELLKNDFEPAVFQEFPKLREIKSRLMDYGAIFTSMSGSGSAIFGLFKKPIPDQLTRKFAGCFVWRE